MTDELAGWASREGEYVRAGVERLSFDGALCVLGLITVGDAPPIATLIGALTERARERWIEALGLEAALDRIWYPAEFPVEVVEPSISVDWNRRVRANRSMRRRLVADGVLDADEVLWDALARELNERPPAVELARDYLAFVVEHDSNDLFERLPRYVSAEVLSAWRSRDLLRWRRFDIP